MAGAAAADRAVDAFLRQEQRAFHAMGLHGRQQGGAKGGKIFQRDEFVEGGDNNVLGHGQAFIRPERVFQLRITRSTP